jgi:MoaA/NifB/PqqE/SkfB family radical SAM enzyme
MKMDFLEEFFRRFFYLQPPLPYTAQIEVTNECNLACPMCPRIDLKVPIKSMTLGTYKKIVDKLEGVRELVLTGWGEPLFHKDIIKMIKYAKNKGFKVRLTTNGTLLTEDLQDELLSSEIDEITFSVDEVRKSNKSLGHPLIKQLENIERFTKKRRDKKPKVTLQSTIHKGKEKNILDIIEFASRIGAERVNLMRLDIRFQKLPRPTVKQEKRLLKKAEKLGKKLGVQIDFLPHVALNGIARFFYRNLVPFLYRFGKYCPKTLGYIYINVDGQATPCCSLPLWSVGNLLKEDLEKIWKGQKFQKFREHDFQRKICGKCDVLEARQWEK